MKKGILIPISIILILIFSGSLFVYLYQESKETPKKEESHSSDPVKLPEINEEPSDPTPEEPVNKTSKGFVIEEIDGITYIDGYLVVNRTYSVPKDYKPKNPHGTLKSYCYECVEEEAYQAFDELRTKAKEEGLSYRSISGYRSYDVQKSIYDNKVNKGGVEYAEKFSARAGYSEHQTGLALDLNSTNTSFGRTKEGIWLSANCYKFGFILRYPEGKKEETGFNYEPWHIRYVGKELAEKLYNDGDWITLEDYFGITSIYPN